MNESTETSSANAAEKPNQSVWKNFKQIFPYLSVFIIILGLLYEGLYYWYFNIDIQDYVGVSELLLSISKVAVYVIVLTTAFFLLARYPENVQIAHETKDENNNKERKKGTRILFAIVLSVGLVILFIVAMIFFVYPRLVIIFFFGGYFMLATLTTAYFKKSRGKYLNQDKVGVFVTALLLITLFVVTKAVIQSKIVEKGEYVGTRIYTKDSTYVSDLNHFYIGKTANYYFIFNKDRDFTTVLPEREVTRFELKENQIWVDDNGNPLK